MEAWADRYECTWRGRAGAYHAAFQRTQQQPYIQLGAIRAVELCPIELCPIMLVSSNVIKRNQRFNSNAWRNGALYVSISRY